MAVAGPQSTRDSTSYTYSVKERRYEANRLIYSFIYFISIYRLPLMYQELCYLLWGKQR